MLDVPAVVRNKALAHGAGAWLASLPDVVAELEATWDCHIGRAFGDSTEAFVAEARLGDGTDAVVKVMVPRDGGHAAREASVLRLANGQGCVRLLREDAARGALLLERLGPSLFELGLPIERRHEILADTAAALWRRAPDVDLPTGAAKGEWLVAFITSAWERLDRPCSERAVDHAVRCAERRIAAHDDERSVLVHGDVHQWNVLRSADGFKLVDPDGLLADAEYDLGIIMREDPLELLVGDPWDRARWLAARTGTDATAIWEWGVVERVSTGLLAEDVGLQPVGRQMLAVADRLGSIT
jgi:streptomycin 6-kinase